MKASKLAKKNDKRTAYKKPELVSFGSIAAKTLATSAGTVSDGGLMPNMNVRMV